MRVDVSVPYTTSIVPSAGLHRTALGVNGGSPNACAAFGDH